MFRRGFYHYRRRLDRGRALRAALFLTTALLLTAAFMADSLATISGSWTATITGDCLPMPVGA